ncbi:hypothetical protein OHC33_007277 [Knufia fluminis]|uniref:Transcription factor domain-containing protein n=2 Tax=Knufia TaxID=430999 RepID=A0AAN8EBN0_9EURO|nr:hypothetical protein OHC33_007277 [Knufia fluminis]
MGSESTRPWYDSETLDWAWYDARYYAQAITLLRENLGRSQSSDDEASMPGTPGVACNVGGITDEVLAAMTILCCYEYMSASDTDWLRHLSGTMLLLDLQKDREKWHMSSYPSRARRSIFWNFARQDLYAAFILGGSTRLDSEDLEIWRASGLRLDDQGFVMPSRDEQDANTMKDDMVSNALIWIFTKIVNYTAIKNGAGQDQQQRLAMQWNKLSLELDIWFRGLSERFKPYARYDLEEDTANDISATPAATRSAKYPFPCIWYSSKMCASTMQTYHLARILLLVHRTATDTLLPHPQLSRTGAPANTSGQSTISAYLENLRAQQTEIQYRSREICGIAMSSPTKACIYLHQTQTLFVAGQCLSDPQERRVILDLLRRVNVELGWETEYRVEQLLKEWGWK